MEKSSVVLIPHYTPLDDCIIFVRKNGENVAILNSYDALKAVLESFYICPQQLRSLLETIDPQNPHYYLAQKLLVTLKNI